ncbi:MAG: alpha/beta fold hydrolase [candidate division FCPU426 bacterium]
MNEAAASLDGKPIRLTGGPRALVFLHGFTCSPKTVLPVAEELARAGFTLSLPLLPGSGTTPEDLASHSSRDWLDAAVAAWDELARTHPRPAVAGLSMGGALALHVASVRPVSAVVALSPALYLRDWRQSFLPVLAWLGLWREAGKTDVKVRQFEDPCYSRHAMKSLMDLRQVMAAAREALPRITAPLLTIQAQEDHVIPPDCMDYCYRHAGSAVKEKHRLTDSYHVITLDQEYLTVAGHMRRFLSAHLPQA